MSKPHSFQLLPIQEQLDTIAYRLGASQLRNSLHAAGIHVASDPSKVQSFLDEYYRDVSNDPDNTADATFDQLLTSHAEFKSNGALFEMEEIWEAIRELEKQLFPKI